MPSKLLLAIYVAFISFTWGQNNVQSLLRQSDDIYFEDPAQSFFLCEEAELIVGENAAPSLKADIAMCKARYLILTAQFDFAEVALNSALEVYQAANDQSNIAAVYSSKSVLYYKLGDGEKSTDFLWKSIRIRKTLNDTIRIISDLNNLSLNYMDMMALDSAENTLKELSTFKPSFESDDYYFYFQNWGNFWLLKGDWGKALKLFQKALKVAEEEKMTDSKATILVFIARAFRIKGDYEKAAEYGLQSYNFSMDNDLIYETNDALKELILIKEEAGNYKEAFQLQRKKIGIENEIYEIEKIQKIKLIEGQLLISEKEKEITAANAALKEERLIAEQAQAKATILTTGIIIAGILIALIGFFFIKTKRLNALVNSQKRQVEIKSMHLETALDAIHDSLEYSKLIQEVILPEKSIINKYFEDHFIMYRPKDIVSGDFYWLNEIENKLILAVADCTGHGVPGAMVSVICNEALNKVVQEHRVNRPGLILDETRTLVIQSFNQSMRASDNGMDIALIAMEGNKLSFSGAHNPVWIIRKGNSFNKFSESSYNVIYDEDQDATFIEIKGDKQPIGRFSNMTAFKEYEFELEKNDLIYLFSDGYADQFGGNDELVEGKDGKKFKTSNFKRLLLSLHNLTMEEQNIRLNAFFDQWKGDLEQLDDVCVMGIRV